MRTRPSWLVPLIVLPCIRAVSSAGHSRRVASARAARARLARSAADEPARTDWRSFRANLVREQRGIAGAQALHTDEAPSGGGDWWVHELAAPEPGCLLLAQPHAHIVVEEPLMHRAVVLVLEHDAARGTVGLLLDTPANATVSQMLRRRAEPSPHLLPLGGNQLLVGGTVLPRERLRVLTSRCDVPGARRVLPGLYSCAPDAAARMVAIGAADAASFDVYAAACQWSPLQLREELEAALWLPAAASAAAIARPREWRRDGVYFNLVEGLGGQYLKQARRRGCLWARAGGGVPVVAAVGRRLQGGCLRRAVGREGRGLCEVRLGRGARRCCHRELLALRAPCTPPPFPDILGSAPPGAARPHGGGGEVVAGDPLRPSARPAPRPRGGRPLRGGGWRGREEGGWRRARGARGGAATASGDGGRGVVSAPRASLPSLPPGAARGERQLWRLPCQALLYPRDNLTDVRDGVGSLAEQAGGLGLGLGLG